MPVRCRIVLVSMEKQGGCGMIYLSVPDGADFFMPKRSETRRSETGTKYKKGEESMKVYKKLMNALAAVEKVVLIVSTLLILVLMVLHRRAGCSGICSHHTSGSSTCMSERRTGQSVTVY